MSDESNKMSIETYQALVGRSPRSGPESQVELGPDRPKLTLAEIVARGNGTQPKSKEGPKRAFEGVDRKRNQEVGAGFEEDVVQSAQAFLPDVILIHIPQRWDTVRVPKPIGFSHRRKVDRDLENHILCAYPRQPTWVDFVAIWDPSLGGSGSCHFDTKSTMTDRWTLDNKMIPEGHQRQKLTKLANKGHTAFVYVRRYDDSMLRPDDYIIPVVRGGGFPELPSQHSYSFSALERFKIPKQNHVPLFSWFCACLCWDDYIRHGWEAVTPYTFRNR